MRISRGIAVALAAGWLAASVGSAAFGQAALEAGNPVEGAIDFHVHSAPDAFARNVSDIEVAELAARRGMRAIVLKNHITMTADRAALVNEVVPGIEVFGGVVLNNAVGGLNPAAVEVMATMSGGRGKVVWLPTRDAQHDITTFDKPGEGISVAENGQVTPEMDAVLQKIAEHDLVLQTGHVAPEEIMAVIRRARELGIDHFILAWDLGQSGNPIHPDGYEILVRGLEVEGIPFKDIQMMMSDNPARLLGLDTKG